MSSVWDGVSRVGRFQGQPKIPPDDNKSWGRNNFKTKNKFLPRESDSRDEAWRTGRTKQILKRYQGSKNSFCSSFIKQIKKSLFWAKTACANWSSEHYCKDPRDWCANERILERCCMTNFFLFTSLFARARYDRQAKNHPPQMFQMITDINIKVFYFY
jgi:hypothetical protein